MRILQLKEHIQSFLLNDAAVLRLSCVETNNKVLGRTVPSTLDYVTFLQVREPEAAIPKLSQHVQQGRVLELHLAF